MGKYYVRCGGLKAVMDRESRERAAFDAVHREARSGDGRFHEAPQLRHLGLITSVSEQSFKSQKASHYATHRILGGVGEFEDFEFRSREG